MLRFSVQLSTRIQCGSGEVELNGFSWRSIVFFMVSSFIGVANGSPWERKILVARPESKFGCSALASRFVTVSVTAVLLIIHYYDQYGGRNPDPVAPPWIGYSFPFYVTGIGRIFFSLISIAIII